MSRKKIGYLVAGIVGDDLTVGFSLCHRKDEYNVVDGVRVPDWGRTVAIKRALKWKGHIEISVPPSIMPNMNQFLDRCSKYYKDRICPVAVPQVQGNEAPPNTIDLIIRKQ